MDTTVACDVALTVETEPQWRTARQLTITGSSLAAAELGKRAQLTPAYLEAIDGCSSIQQLLTNVSFKADSPMAKQPFSPIYCISKVCLLYLLRPPACIASVACRPRQHVHDAIMVAQHPQCSHHHGTLRVPQVQPGWVAMVSMACSGCKVAAGHPCSILSRCDPAQSPLVVMTPA